MTDRASDLALALRIADEADAITRARFGALDLRVDDKPDLTPVSDADLAVERAVRATLGEHRPADSVLGEEFGGDAVFEGRQWVVDPIDGTKNFVRNVPVWATLISLLEDGVPVVGVVSAPALNRRWWAATGLGAHTSFGDG
ncbi:MAG: inositol monophosphatase family protein, partial [Rhodococcus sp. (in: high G+C Gram-positive bacteria)]